VRKLAAVICLVLTIFACTGSGAVNQSDATAAAREPTTGTTDHVEIDDGPDPTDFGWELVSGSLDGSPVPIVEGHPITLAFVGNLAKGRAACNLYESPFRLSQTSLTFSEIAVTEMMCHPVILMEAELSYVEALSRAESYVMTDQQLRFVGEEIDLLFDGLPLVAQADLTGRVWVLEGLIDMNSVVQASGERATLELFSDRSLIGSTGCSDFHGTYELVGAEVWTTQMSSQGDCISTLSDQEAQVFSVLSGGFRVMSTAETLTLMSADGNGLAYRTGT
jgi:heat shock protein HslJ